MNPKKEIIEEAWNMVPQNEMCIRDSAKRDCYICGGEIKENAIISGKAFIDTVGVNARCV